MTINQANRRYLVQWRAYVGPPWRKSDASDFWDWSQLDLWAYEPSVAETALIADLEPAATTATLAGAGTYPTAGGCWIGPNATGETWEYVSYTGKSGSDLTGLTRETVSAEQTGHHTLGATVRFWYPLTIDTAPDYTSSMGDALADTYWSATLRGHEYPQAALRNRHLVLIQARWAEGAGGDWGSWTTELVGWLLNPALDDSAGDPGAWTCDVVSSRGMLDLVKVGGLRVGEPNVAASGSALGSTELAATYKERGSGEFTSAEPDVTPDSAIDGDLDTLYISERMIGSDNQPTGYGYYLYAPDQLHISPYTGQASGYRWLQVRAGYSADYDWGIILRNNDGYCPGDGGIWWDNTAQRAAELGDPLIFVENEALFLAENSDLGDSYEIYEISDDAGRKFYDEWGNEIAGYTALNWWDAMAPAGGSLTVLISQGASLNNLAGGVAWGSVSGDPTWWAGPSLAALGPGETIRRKWAIGGNSATGYAVGRASTPGYWLNGTDSLWLDVACQPLGLRLRDDIDASQTTNIYITGDLGDSLDGLPAAGTLQIGGEQLSYTAKSATNDYLEGVTRGVNSTPAAAHTSGDLIYVVVSGVATDAIPIAEIHVKRATGQPVPQDFAIYGSLYSAVRTPDDGEAWFFDYELIEEVTGNASEDYTLALSPSVRYRHILILATRMSEDPYRLMVNEVTLDADLTVYSAAQTLTSGTVADAAEALLSLAGFPPGAITDNGDTPTVADFTTDSGFCGDVCADLADFGGCRFDVGRDSKVLLRLDPYWSSGSLPAEDVNWVKALAGSLQAEMAHGLDVGQVALAWRDATNAADGTARYPTAADGLGEVVEVGPYIYADATAALAGATKRYWMMRRPYGALVAAAGPAWNLDAGDVCGVYWAAQTGGLLDRTYLIQEARHAGEGGKIDSVFQVLQISGSDET